MPSVRNGRKWLEIAAAIVDINKCIKGRIDLPDNVCRIKSVFDEGFIGGVMNDLESRRLVSVGA